MELIFAELAHMEMADARRYYERLWGRGLSPTGGISGRHAVFLSPLHYWSGSFESTKEMP